MEKLVLTFSATEPSVKLLENVRQYDFFDMRLVIRDSSTCLTWMYCSHGCMTKSTFDLSDIDAMVKSITDIVNTIGVTRLVIDSVTTLCYKIPSEQLIRDFLFKLGKSLATLGCTALLVSEITCREPRHIGLLSVLKK